MHKQKHEVSIICHCSISLSTVCCWNAVRLRNKCCCNSDRTRSL